MFVKILDGDYILGVAIASTGIEIGEQEYNELTEIFLAMPEAPEGYYYMLRENETWELIEKEPEPTSEEPTDPTEPTEEPTDGE